MLIILRTTLLSVVLLLMADCGAFCALRQHAHQDEEPIPTGTPPYRLSMAGREVDVYVFGTAGPPVLLLHELPGLTHECIRLAEQIRDAGYRVYVPLLFGGYGESRSGARQLLKACRSGGFHCLSASHSTSPLTKFLRSDVLPLMKADGRHTVVIGMCLTGHVGATLLDEEFVKAAVMSQPALPLEKFGYERRLTGLSSSETAAVHKSGKPILAFRFTNDCVSPAERMASFQAVFGPQVYLTKIDSRLFHPSAHAVLTQEYRKGTTTAAAVEQMITFLDCNLKSNREKCTP